MGELSKPLNGSGEDTRAPDYLVAHGRGRYRFVAVDSIQWIEGAGNYARLHCPDGKFLVRASLAKLEVELGDRGFMRVHRGALVPVREFRELVARSSQSAHLELRSGYAVRVSRAFQKWFLGRDEKQSSEK